MSLHDVLTAQVRLTPTAPAVLSRQLRQGSGPFMARRRAVVGLSLLAGAAMQLITLYQTGIIRHLPEPPLPFLDADRVDASREGYSRLSTPDGILGLGSYTATMALAAMGGADRAATAPWIPLALAAKVGFDVAQAVRLTVTQWRDFHAFCGWCLLAAGATVASVPLVVPEARAALKHTLARPHGRATRG
ncbi:MAG TPA: vitamin K epoxide reductase family protein [Ktedonobacterales bacterium]|jgi:hypothetical protein